VDEGKISVPVFAALPAANETLMITLISAAGCS
jgi:hypothetical protein